VRRETGAERRPRKKGNIETAPDRYEEGGAREGGMIDVRGMEKKVDVREKEEGGRNLSKQAEPQKTLKNGFAGKRGGRFQQKTDGLF